MSDRLTRFAKQVFLPLQQLLLEVFLLPFVHEWFVLGRTVFSLFEQRRSRLHGHLSPYEPVSSTGAALIAKPSERAMNLVTMRDHAAACVASSFASSTAARVSISANTASRPASSVMPRCSLASRASDSTVPRGSRPSSSPIFRLSSASSSRTPRAAARRRRSSGVPTSCKVISAWRVLTPPTPPPAPTPLPACGAAPASAAKAGPPACERCPPA